MSITIINDCADANAASRQSTRVSTLLREPVHYVAVGNDLEAAGNLIDALDAAEGRAATILVNVAPRHGEAKKWANGTPFCYFKYHDSLVVSSVDGRTLSLVKKFGLADAVCLLDIPTAGKELVDRGVISSETYDHLVDTQFRSFDFTPRVAAFVREHGELVHERHSLENISDAPRVIWWIDNFGNCKTTLTEQDVDVSGGTVTLPWGTFPYYRRLKDVPNHTAAVVTGSSGINGHRFLEFVVQGEHAAKKFNLMSGMEA